MSSDKKTIGRFEIIREIGSGGMGLVYLGLDPRIGRKVALKVIKTGATASASVEHSSATVNRFYVEARAAGQISHPNIVTIYDVGETVYNDSPLVYIAMEYVEGQGLDWHIQNNNFTKLEEQLRILKMIAQGLDYAHKRDIIHRDIKPANILITTDGNIPKITDFGLARLSDSSLTMSGTILGTPNYMSPEQIQSDKIDNRSDIFSLTVMMYELLTREKPFAGESVTSIIYKVVNVEPDPPRHYNSLLPREVDLFIKQGLSKNPDERFQNCENFIKGIDSLLQIGTSSVQVVSESTGIIGEPYAKLLSKFQTEEQKRKVSIIAGAVVGVIVIIFALVSLFSIGGPPVEQPANIVDSPKIVVKRDIPNEVIPPKEDEEARKVAAAKEEEAKKAAVAKKKEEAKKAAVAKKKEEAKKVAAAKKKEEAKKAAAAKKKEEAKKVAAAKKKEEAKKVAAAKKKEEAKKVVAAKKKVTPKKKAVTPVATVNVKSSPSGAKVFLNGKQLGTTPISKFKVRNGTYLLVAKKAGYQDYKKSIKLESTQNISIKLVKSGSPSAPPPAAPMVYGALEIYVPPNTIINVDGIEYRTRVVKLDKLSPGSHRVYIQTVGRAPIAKRVTIEAGDKEVISIK
ncbi:MAG: serine/threonine-protein kinase [Nitrospinota bacterium]